MMDVDCSLDWLVGVDCFSVDSMMDFDCSVYSLIDVNCCSVDSLKDLIVVISICMHPWYS